MLLDVFIGYQQSGVRYQPTRNGSIKRREFDSEQGPKDLLSRWQTPDT
jgi:hypothetical protein